MNFIIKPQNFVKGKIINFRIKVTSLVPEKKGSELKIGVWTVDISEMIQTKLELFRFLTKIVPYKFFVTTPETS